MRAERFILAAALIAGGSYTFAPALAPVHTAAAIAWKGAGVGLLALWCTMQARSRDDWLIAAVMLCGALGDVLLETSGLTAGAIAFALGHLLAIALFSSHPRERVSGSQRALAFAVLIITPALAWLFTRNWGATAYALILGLMASRAWLSRFPRYRVGIGAMLFVASDLLIFARLGPLARPVWTGSLIWPLYFAGQALIATGVVDSLRKGRGMTSHRQA